MASPIRFPLFPRPLRDLMSPLRTSARGMSSQQRFLEVISSNIAHAGTTSTPEGGPYRRQVAVNDAQGTRVVLDPRPGRSVYDPGHPDADADGFVTMPNVDLNNEIVDLMVARRMFEANATVFQAAKSMLRRALEI
jgi:flagellar basal-body rod protein FlgC